MTKLCLAHILCKCSAEFIGGLGKKSCGGLEGLGKQLCTIIALYHHVLEQAITQTGNAGNASSISISFIDDASPTILPACGITNPCSMCALSASVLQVLVSVSSCLLELVQQFALQPTIGHTC